MDVTILLVQPITSRVMPSAMIAGDERVGLDGSFGSGSVIRKCRSGQPRPGFFDRRDNSPFRFHFVVVG